MPERFNLPDPRVKEDDLFTLMLLRAERVIRKSARHFKGITPDPALGVDDYYQHTCIALSKYVDTHRDEVWAMVRDTASAHLERFTTLFCKRRMTDLWETTVADRRNQAITFNASAPNQHLSDDGSHYGTLLESVAHTQGINRGVDPDSAERVTTYLEGLSVLARRIMAALLKPPRDLQESFLGARTRIAYGRAEIVPPERPTGQASMVLTPREGFSSFTWGIDWEGPLRHGVIQTSHGNMTVSDETDMWRMEFGFPLLVLSDGHEGEYEHRSIRPTPACFDVKAMAKYLSKGRTIPVFNCHVQHAWAEATARFTALFGQADDEPEPQPNHRHAVEVA